MRPCNRLNDRRNVIVRRSSMAAYASVTSQFEIEDAARCAHRVPRAAAPAHGEHAALPRLGR
jgi:hypothetical protein